MLSGMLYEQICICLVKSVDVCFSELRFVLSNTVDREVYKLLMYQCHISEMAIVLISVQRTGDLDVALPVLIISV